MLLLQGTRNEWIWPGRGRPVVVVQTQHPEMIEAQAADLVKAQHLDARSPAASLKHSFAADPLQQADGFTADDGGRSGIE